MMTAAEVFSRMRSLKGIFSVSDAVYLALCDLDGHTDLERARRKLKKYDDALASSFDVAERYFLQTEFYHFGGKVHVAISERDGWIYFDCPASSWLTSVLKGMKGYHRKGQIYVFPAENGVEPIKAMEEDLDIYIDYDNPAACFAAVIIVPEARRLRLAVFAPCKSINDLLNSSKYWHDTVKNVYEIKVKTDDDFQAKLDFIEATGGEIRLVRESESRITAMHDALAGDAADRDATRVMSASESTPVPVRSPAGLTPYPYQVVAVDFIRRTFARTLIADEMGLGKTPESCLFFYNNPEYYPFIAIVPNNVKVNWCREIKKWCDLSDDDIQYITGLKPTVKNAIIPGKKVYIINYEIIRGRVVDLSRVGAKTLVIDEAHNINNYKSQRTQACFDLSKVVHHAICLTGTPIINKPIDLWSIIVVTGNADKFGGFFEFTKRYCDGQETRFGWKCNGATNLDELQSKLRETLMLRRFKADVLPEIPPKRRIVLPIEITNRGEYNRARYDFLTWYHDHRRQGNLEKAEAIVKIEMLKQISFKGKERDLVGFIKDVAENHDKIVIFFSHVANLANVREKIKRDFTVSELTSEENVEKRQEIVDNFNAIPRCILLCSVKVAREGINLPTADVVIFSELGWTAALHDQAESRCHRIGQRNQVDVYYVVAGGTIEESIIDLLNKKFDVAGSSVGSGDVTDEFLSTI